MDTEHHSPAEHWENRYADNARIWSGRANAALMAETADLTPGTALDLGCGEGGDALWLAQQGWTVTGVDISPTAIARGEEAARDLGIDPSKIRLIAADLETWTTDQEFDLVTASFLHSMVELSRTDILRRAAGLVAPGGHLLIVSHADFPPWSSAHDHEHEHRFLSPDEEIADLDLDLAQWDVVVAESRDRDATGPNGEQAVIQDGVVRLRRH